MKYVIQIYEGRSTDKEKEGLPAEYQYEFEREMLKHVKLKKDMRERDGFKEILRGFPNLLPTEAMNPMVNWIQFE